MTPASIPLAIGAALAAALAATPVFAQSDAPYPSRPMRIVVPFPPGGGADLTARTIGQKMGEALGQPVVVDNRPGANGLIGTELVAKGAPDGYTILLVDRGALGINPSLYSKLPYDPLKDFAYVGIATEAPYVLVVNSKLPAKSVPELVALAKARPRSIHYGSFGVGSMAQLNLEAFNQRLGTDLQHVPYKGAAAAVNAVVAGEVDVAVTSAPSVLGFIRDGRLRAIAVGADKRLALLPEVPTIAEAGADADILVPTYFALAAPAGTPPQVIARLNAELKRAVASPDVSNRLIASGLVPAGGAPEAMANTVKKDVAWFGALVRTIGIRPE